MGTLEEGAANAVKRCMGVKSSDRVLIVTDSATKQVALAIHDLAARIAASRIFVLEDYTERPFKRIPDAIMRSVAEATVTFWVARSYEGELGARASFRIEAVKHARHAHMPGITKEIMEEGMCADYDSIHRTTLRLHELLRKAGKIQVSSPEGTSLDLEFNKNWKWIPSHGIMHQKGQWGNLPDGEVFTAPYRVNGRITVSELGDWFTGKYGYLKEERVRMEIEDSRIILGSVECRDQALMKELVRYLSTDENSSRASEFALPTNLYLIERPLVGNMLQDEKARVHIAFGDPYGRETNADWSSSTHIDCILEGCDLATDGTEIMRSGRLLLSG